MLNQTPIGSVSLNDKQTPVILEPVLDTKTAKDLEIIPVMTETGMVPVSSVAKLESEERSTNQFHKDGETYLQVTASVDPAKLSEISTAVNIEIFGDKKNNKGIDLPDGCRSLSWWCKYPDGR